MYEKIWMVPLRRDGRFGPGRRVCFHFRKWFGGGDDESDTNESTDTPSDENNNLTGPQDEEGKKGGRLLGKKKETGEYDADGYLKGEIPWSLSFNYSMSLGYGTFNPNNM